MIRFDQVEKSFGTHQVLRGVSFEVPPGEIWFVLGTSGTGKSVLLKTIVGLLDANSGRVFVDNEDVTHFDEPQRLAVRRKCGMVFQQPALFDSLSVFDNVAFGLRKHHPELDFGEIASRVRECLRLVQLEGIEDKFPPQISFGMQKRVSLARSVAVKPKILLFDEPTTGLDPVTTNAINQLILDLSRELKTTSLVVTHDMGCALAIADHILVLDRGHVAAHGTPAELKNSEHPLVRDFLAEALRAEGA